MHRRRLPIASPCSERFSTMEVLDDRQRYCDRCEREVHDLSSMTRVEAEYFMLQRRRRGESACIRYEVQRDEQIRFRPAPPRTAGPVLVAFAGLMAACTGHLEPADLDSPEEGLTCEDAAGYTIPCIDDGSAPERIEVVDPIEIDDEPIEVVDEPGDEGIEVDPGDPPPWVADEQAAGDEATGEGCPLKRWDDPPEEVYELAGVMPDVSYTRAEERRIEREYREERRGRARRQQRRQRRRERRDV